jgi:hypothetical protein
MWGFLTEQQRRNPWLVSTIFASPSVMTVHTTGALDNAGDGEGVLEGAATGLAEGDWCITTESVYMRNSSV